MAENGKLGADPKNLHRQCIAQVEYVEIAMRVDLPPRLGHFWRPLFPVEDPTLTLQFFHLRPPLHFPTSNFQPPTSKSAA